MEGSPGLPWDFWNCMQQITSWWFVVVFPLSLATHLNPKNRATGILSWCPQHFNILGMFPWILWIDEYSSILLWLPFSLETFYSSEFCKTKDRNKQQQKIVQQFFFQNLIFKLFNYFYCILVSCTSGNSSEKIVTFVSNWPTSLAC